jgi:two-component sensor histidine kinase
LNRTIHLDLPRNPSGERTHADLLRAQKEALELALGGASLDHVLNLIVRSAADQTASRAAIFLVDEVGAFLRFSVASGLPESYTRAVDGFLIGPSSPSCGNAAYTGERVVVNDVCEDPLWQPFLALANENGIRACWSTPIRNFEGEVLGTLATYHASPRSPETEELEAIDLLAHTASVLIGRARAERGHRVALELARANELAAQEMSHRIMNSFQVLQSLIAMQTKAAGNSDVRAALGSVSGRVQAMATMHQLLLKGQRENGATIDLVDYLPQLIESVTTAFIGGDRFTLAIEVEPGARLAADKVSSVGLIATELVMNALKHSSPHDQRCHISVTLRDIDESFHLVVSDNGVGMPPGGETSVVGGLGTKLIKSLARRLGGAVEIDRTPPGARFVVSFPNT